jgi:Xaa-Pro dipeptidase
MAHTPDTGNKSPLAHAKFQSIRQAMADLAIDAWLVWDFRHNNPVLATILGSKPHLTRRVLWLMPANGQPSVLCSAIDEEAFRHSGIAYTTYRSWAQLNLAVENLIRSIPAHHGSSPKIAMEYAPGAAAAMPTVGIVDAGTIDWIRSLGATVVSSANLVQAFASPWSPHGLTSHQTASAKTRQIMSEAFAFIAQQVKNQGSCQEFLAQQYICDFFKKHNLSYPDDPIVSVNANAAMPHYGPDRNRSTPIGLGDWVLVDLWARTGDDSTIYSDITWTGYLGPRSSIPDHHNKVFHAVREARDSALSLAQARFASKVPVQGWELDDAARAVLERAGFAQAIKHRTGHSLSPGALVHGNGMNLDNLETRDTRIMMPHTGFTIEPGIYLDGKFGVRNEINVYVDPALGPVVTSCMQDLPWAMD